jgi:hypothetical protein
VPPKRRSVATRLYIPETSHLQRITSSLFLIVCMNTFILLQKMEAHHLVKIVLSEMTLSVQCTHLKRAAWVE